MSTNSHVKPGYIKYKFLDNAHKLVFLNSNHTNGDLTNYCSMPFWVLITYAFKYYKYNWSFFTIRKHYENKKMYVSVWLSELLSTKVN